MASSVQSQRGVVSTSQPRASEAGAAVLREGGNAIDAAVAAFMVVCAIQPSSVGFAGYGGSAVIYLAKERKTTVIDFDSRAPLAFRPELYEKPGSAVIGYLAPGVPGVTAGLDLALRSHGTLSWAKAVKWAITAAEEGFIVNADMAESMAHFAKSADKTSIDALFTNGHVPAAGERFVPKDLAQFLRDLGNDPDALYRGEFAALIVRHVREHGGILTEEDFHQYHATEVDPISINYRGYQLYTPPPPSGGTTSLGILKTLEQFPVSTLQRWGAPYVDLFASASARCWAERFETLGDPDFVKPPVEQMLSESAAVKRAEAIRAGAPRPPANVPPAAPHTANVIAIDSQRNMVSITATHGGTFGSTVTIPGLGLTLGHGMSRFTFKPGASNFPAPGKRMQHNMAPLILLKEGQPAGVLGLPGGTHIVTVTAQFVVDLIDFGTAPVDAVLAPRFHNDGTGPISVAPELPEDVTSELELIGHEIKRLPLGVGGKANVATVSADQATLTAGSQADDAAVSA